MALPGSPKDAEPPRSMQLFTALFWLGTALSALAEFWFWDQTTTELSEEFELSAEMTLIHEGAMIAAFVAIFALNILLWFFTAEKRSRIAKWIYIVLAVAGSVSLAGLIDEYSLMQQLIYGGSALLGLASVLCLFQRDSRNWFARNGKVDPKVFE
jgi:hypothetical protein